MMYSRSIRIWNDIYMKILSIQKTVVPWITKMWKRFERRMTLTKRQQFVIITLVLSLILLLTQLISGNAVRYPLVLVLAIMTFIGSAFGLREDLQGIEWFTLLIPITLYSTAVSLFYFLLPSRWLTRIPVAVLYAVGLYALLLTENIYNVAANRTIALLRAARSVGFLMTIFTYYLLTLTALSFRLLAPWNTLCVLIISFFHAFPALWTIELGGKASKRVLAMSIAITVVLGELVWALSFWPMPTTMVALLLSAVFYCTVGMGQEYLGNKLYKKTVIEFFLVCLLVFIAALLTTKWRAI